MLRAAARRETGGVTHTSFDVEVRFLGGLTGSRRDAFTEAAERWEDVIVGDLPDAVVDGEPVDDPLIRALGDEIDGPGPPWAKPPRPRSARRTSARPRSGPPRG